MEASKLKRKSMLFTFKARPGEECSSDSQDSDYYPGRESEDEDNEIVQRTRTNIAKRRKKAKSEASKSSSKHKTRKTVIASLDSGSTDHGDGSQFILPAEVMVRIFQFGIWDVGVTDFIPRVAQVCKEWNRIASDSSMFQYLDLSTNHVVITKKSLPTLKRFLNNDISQCRYLSLFGQVHLSSSVIENTLKLTPRLRNLDLHGCGVKPELVKLLPQLCPLIQRIDLSSCASSHEKIKLVSVEALIKGLGPNLVELRIINSLAVMQNPDAVFKIIQENCPNMEELDLSVTHLITDKNLKYAIHLEKLAVGCPKLKELYINGITVLECTMPHEPYKNSFKNLQVYSQANQSHLYNEMPAFYRLFGSVPKLRELNVSYSRLLPSRISQWVKEVEELHLGGMMWIESEEADMIECIAAWRMSLETLDLSHNRPCGMVIDAALSQFGNPVESHEHPLRVLNLSNSNVTPRGVIHVIKSCKNLQEINLTSCRELPRGTKREFKKEEFSTLLKNLRPFTRENDDGSATSNSD